MRIRVALFASTLVAADRHLIDINSWYLPFVLSITASSYAIFNHNQTEKLVVSAAAGYNPTDPTKKV